MQHQIDKKTLKRINELAHKKWYSLRHINAVLELEGYTKPSLSWLSKLVGLARRGKFKKINKFI